MDSFFREGDYPLHEWNSDPAKAPNLSATNWNGCQRVSSYAESHLDTHPYRVTYCPSTPVPDKSRSISHWCAIPILVHMQDQSTSNGSCADNPREDSLFTLASDQSQVIPVWTGFNIKLKQNDVPRESSIGYCQVIDASPTEMPTVYKLLQRSL